MSGDVMAPERSFPFIVARGRSGTTLLRAMLDTHPDMAIPNESHFVVQLARRRSRYETASGFQVRRFTSDLLDHWAFKRWGLPADDVIAAYEVAPPTDCASAIRTLYAAYANHHGKSRYGDKTPSYVMNIDLLAAMFAEARFVHLIRDGRNVAMSYLDADFGSKTLGQAALYWGRFVRAGRAAGARLGSTRYLEVRYEDLVEQPERVLGEVCAFVGLTYDPSMLRYYERAGSLDSQTALTSHHPNLFKPPTAGMRDWRRDLPPHKVAVFEALAGDLLDELGYERATPRPGPWASASAAWFRASTQLRRVAHGVRRRIRRLRRRAIARLRRRTSPSSSSRASVSSTQVSRTSGRR
jgi:hypothetical protein